MVASDAPEGTRVVFVSAFDGVTYSGVVGRPQRVGWGRSARWYIPVKLDNPTDTSGPGLALPEDHLVTPSTCARLPAATPAGAATSDKGEQW